MTRPEVTLSTPWHFPTPGVTRLDNGLTVWEFHLPHQHIATFEVVLPASLTAEPASKRGVGSLALHSIDEGTLAHPDGAFSELLESHGAALHGTARHRHTTFGGQSPTRRIGEVLPLFLEVLTQPAYAERDIAHHVEAAVAEHASKLASPGAATRLALRRALFGDHRDGLPASGLPSTVETLTADDARAWHAAAFHPQGATVVAAGAMNPGSFEALSQWRVDGASLVDHAPAPRLPRRVVVVDQPGAVQATIMLAARTPTRTDPLWPALRVAGHAVAGAFASRLNLELREDLGYTYGISGGFAAGSIEGQFHLGGSVRAEVVGDSVARLLSGLRLEKDVTEEEADDARRYLIGFAPLANETSADIVAQASALAAAGLTPDYLGQHFADLAHVSAQEATDAFRTTVRPDQLTVAIAGDASTVVPALADLGLDAEVVALD